MMTALIIYNNREIPRNVPGSNQSSQETDYPSRVFKSQQGMQERPVGVLGFVQQWPLMEMDKDEFIAKGCLFPFGSKVYTKSLNHKYVIRIYGNWFPP